jgi:hypothetical protein
VPRVRRDVKRENDTSVTNAGQLRGLLTQSPSATKPPPMPLRLNMSVQSHARKLNVQMID